MEIRASDLELARDEGYLIVGVIYGDVRFRL